MNIKFGNFVVDKDGILVNGNYRMDASRLWETREFKGVLLWDWLIHLTEKTWVTSETVGNLNTAFFLAQDLFKNQKPVHASEASIAQTLYVQKQMLENDEEQERKRASKNKGKETILKDFDINDDDFEYKEIELL
ncbi:hypothetical protein [Chryseobacterium sp. JM1]|uniref:hypothetical protein n=1 Tax=Chryseobacterium sp. JM1 TaxID=1233950 RepID=UPI0004E7005A|nr:hypothetical protein [Chryseobacterium sp. JM1]KFF21450.1 hypothetical protein IW22_05640 [Chryseobacterium sp. JM1]